MASLRNTVKDYQDELKDGIAWVAFWREGRSWNADYFYLEPDDAIQALDRSRMEEIREADPAAVMLNSYYCGHLGEDMNLDELAAGVRWHYENGYNQLSDFLEAHDDRLPRLTRKQEPTPTLRGFPFRKSPTGTGRNPTPIFLTGA